MSHNNMNDITTYINSNKYLLGGYNNNFHDNIKQFDNFCDNSKFPSLVSIVDRVKRIIAVGDIHGDMDFLIECLHLAKVIDKSNPNKWIGNDTIIVQVGDQIDKCRKTNKCKDKNNKEGYDMKILMYMSKLHLEAIKSKGAVYSLLGNHELMNVDKDMRYVAYEDAISFSSDPNITYTDALKLRKEFFEKGNIGSKFLGCTRLGGIIIGTMIFIHAGVLPVLARHYDVIEINELIKRWLDGEKYIRMKTQVPTELSTLNKFKNSSIVSPFWTRLFGELDINLPQKDRECDPVTKTLELYKLKGMVIGHTPQFISKHGINSTCNKKLWRVDVGGSNGFNEVVTNTYDNYRKPQVLEILDNMEEEQKLTFNIIS